MFSKLQSNTYMVLWCTSGVVSRLPPAASSANQTLFPRQKYLVQQVIKCLGHSNTYTNSNGYESKRIAIVEIIKFSRMESTTKHPITAFSMYIHQMKNNTASGETLTSNSAGNTMFEASMWCTPDQSQLHHFPARFSRSYNSIICQTYKTTVAVKVWGPTSQPFMR